LAEEDDQQHYAGGNGGGFQLGGGRRGRLAGGAADNTGGAVGGGRMRAATDAQLHVKTAHGDEGDNDERQQLYQRLIHGRFGVGCFTITSSVSLVRGLILYNIALTEASEQRAVPPTVIASERSEPFRPPSLRASAAKRGNHRDYFGPAGQRLAMTVGASSQ
jgi:hypothetical protein